MTTNVWPPGAATAAPSALLPPALAATLNPLPALSGILLEPIGIGTTATAALSLSSGTYVLTTTGGAIFYSGTADNLGFAPRSLTGDGQVTARIFTDSNNNRHCGIMMRETLAAGSKFAAATSGVSSGASYLFYRSTTDGAAAFSTTVSGQSIPIYLRLTRTGSSFQADSSTDGVTWTLGTPQTITMASTIFVGLVGANASQTFDHVTWVSGTYGQVVDGAAVAGLVLLAGQTTKSENGPWTTSTSGAWIRPSIITGGALKSGLVIPIQSGGKINAGSAFVLASSDPLTIDVSDQVWSQLTTTTLNALILAGYLPLTGGTISGALTINNALAVNGLLETSQNLIVSENTQIGGYCLANQLYGAPHPHTTPPTAVGSTGLGSGGSVSVVGTDVAGTITLTQNAADTPSASATVATITFHTAFVTAPFIILVPVNPAAANLASGVIYQDQTNASTTTFVIKSGSVPLPATTSATYLFNYVVIG